MELPIDNSSLQHRIRCSEYHSLAHSLSKQCSNKFKKVRMTFSKHLPKEAQKERSDFIAENIRKSELKILSCISGTARREYNEACNTKAKQHKFSYVK